jgi:hypothetical protein
MSQISRADLISTAVFGAMAVSLTVGVVQFASGHDLTSGPGNALGTGLETGLATTAAAIAQTGINRGAKADRAGPAVAPPAPTRTISIRLDGLADTSVLIRIPAVRETRDVPPAPVPTKPDDRKLTFACEPVVSTLTEVAKLLQPGRCVT